MDEQDTSDGEDSPPELCLGPEAEVSPDSQKILDILQNSLIDRMDKRVRFDQDTFYCVLLKCFLSCHF